MTFIKFCGMTRDDDVLAACDLGVNAVGFVMWPGSPRFVTAARAAALVKRLSHDVAAVGVLVAPGRDDLVAARDAGLAAIQVHGSTPDVNTLAGLDGMMTPLAVWVATSLAEPLDMIPRGRRVLLDAHDPVRHCGTGRTIDWHRAAAAAERFELMLAGGLRPQNVATAVRTVRPFGVDVASGIEDRPGIKNSQAMKGFVAAVREADE